MKSLLMPWCVLVLVSLAACGRKGAASGNSAAFDKATPEAKQVWEAALAADKTNGYADARILLVRLSQQPLTPEQQQAVDQQLTALNARFNTALEKGDPAAQSALEEMRRNPPNRQR